MKKTLGKITAGIGQAIEDVFSPKDTPKTKGNSPRASEYFPSYPESAPQEERIRFLAWKFYREGSFEKVQFTRKWMRNALIFQGYHDLVENAAGGWDAALSDTQDYAYPDNYYRTHILNGTALYVKNAPQFVFAPSAEDFESEAIAQAAESSFEVIKENVNYDALRVLEALQLRIFGNSFRYSYYSLDPRYGHISAPVYQNETVALDQGTYTCPTCQSVGEGNPAACPECQGELPPDAMQPPTMGEVPRQTGTTEYPRGQEQTEVVSPLEVGMRSSALTIRNTPYLWRARTVDRIALQGDYDEADLGGGDTSGGGEYDNEAAGDLALTYQQTLADLPGDPQQHGSWYERSTEFSKCLFLQIWIRPSQYRHDKELLNLFPDGMYAALKGAKVLESKNESLDDHWVHMVYNPVPGRIWGDGDDDLVPKQLQLNETERLIVANQAYNSVPKLAVDSTRVDPTKINNNPDEVLLVKTGNGRPISEAFFQMQGMQLPPETWQWLADIKGALEYHARVSPSAVGFHQPGVNTFGGQQDMADRAEMTYSPLLLLYKEANETWARQVLKLAAENWLDDRVHSVMGINGHWEFRKLRGAMLDLDRVKVIAKLIPVNYAQQQALSAAVASGALNPQDPRVQRKILEAFQLPTELNTFSADAKVQWKEIEKMKQGEPVEPMLLRDNDTVHAEICRTYLNSDACEEDPPEVAAAIYRHMQKHMMQQLKVNQVNAVVEAGGQAAAAQVGGQPQQPGEEEQQPEQGGQRGGQVPKSAPVRQARAQKGRAAKPNTPQPSEGNQYRRQRASGG